MKKNTLHLLVQNILLIDNYDSFTYNLVHLIEKITGEKPAVFRNDKITICQVDAYDKIVFSPGPGIPSEAGLLIPIIRSYATSKPMLGVCLGMQAMTEAFGGSLVNLSQVFHGIATEIDIIKGESSTLFKNITTTLHVGRYHSWVVNPETLPKEFRVSATDRQGNIMAIEHEHLPLAGVQFHPESILTNLGENILRNWLES